MNPPLSTLGLLAALLLPPAAQLCAQIPDAQILGVPDYDWYGGCFGTACGNLMGYWDRNGFPDYYTGPTAGGVAPLDASGVNVGIRSMWASRAGFDGRPASRPGHVDDYWRYYANDSVFSYEDTSADPYVLAGRPEHAPDCIGDFIGLSQKKFTNMNNECDGNIDAYSFVYWATNGERRTNFTQAVDIQSGLRSWAKFRGPGKVKFEPAKGKVDSGRASATALFETPGDYILQVVVDDGSGENAGNFAYQCCWTNAQVKVTVKGQLP